MSNRQRSWRFPLFLIVLAVATGDAVRRLGPERGLLAGFDIAATVFLLGCVLLFLRPVPDIRAAATANDAGRVIRLVVGLAAAISVFAAMTAVIADRSVLTGFDKLLIAASLVLVWVFANTLYAMHYAHLYYRSGSDGRDCGGIDFPGTPDPLMLDFAYFAFTIGVALQTADAAIRSRQIRRVVVGHEILSFFFNVGVLALVINVLGSA